MDQFLTTLISPLVALLGSVVISGFGLALGGAARYGLPPSYRRSGGWLLAGLGGALMLAIALAIAIDGSGRASWIYLASTLAVWFPGFVVASLGARRWTLAASVPAGMVLAYAISLSFVQGMFRG